MKPPTHFEPTGVVCPTCEAAIGEPCHTAMGETMPNGHTDRKDWADELNRRQAEGDDAKWWRWRLRNGTPPAKPRPHGTYAAYYRHKFHGEEPCDPCREAAREYWRNRYERQKEEATS